MHQEKTLGLSLSMKLLFAVTKAKSVGITLWHNLAYLSGAEILVPAFSSAQLALTAASVVPLKKADKNRGGLRRKGTKGFCISFLLGRFSIFNDSDGDIRSIYTDYSEQVFLGLQFKKNCMFFWDKSLSICLKAKTHKEEKKSHLVEIPQETVKF